MNYNDVKTKYSDLVLDYEKKNIRSIDHSFSKLIKQEEFKKKFINNTLNKIIKSRVLRKRPYFYDLILKKYHPINIPYNELNFRGFEVV